MLHFITLFFDLYDYIINGGADMKRFLLSLTILCFLLIARNTYGQSEWTLQNSRTNNDLHSVTWTGSLLVAGDGCGSYTSPDGITWTRHSFPSCGVKFVSWIGGQVIAVGDGGIFTSPDGITWTSRTAGVTNSRLTYAAWIDTMFVVLGSKLVGPAVILTSPDGETWITRYSSDSVLYLNSLAMNDSLIVVVGTNSSGLDAVILTSPDGITWTRQTSTSIDSCNGLLDITWTGSCFIAVGIESYILTSPDGFTWTLRYGGGVGSFLNSIAWNGGLLATVGVQAEVSIAQILTSPEGITWTERFAQLPYGASGLVVVRWLGNNFVAVGAGGSIITSPDGTAWTRQTTGTSNVLNSITFTSSLYVVVGDGGRILTSPLDVGILPGQDGNTKLQNISLKFSGAMFTYTLPSREFVELGIYSISGKKIAVLDNGYKTAGEHSVKLNAGTLPGGLYVYRFKAGSYEESGRLIFSK